MARERMVTRTVINTIAKAMTLNLDTQEVATEDFYILGSFTDKQKALKEVQKLGFTSDKVIIVAVTELKVYETLYGLKEIDFVRYATVLPPRDTEDEEEQ